MKEGDWHIFARAICLSDPQTGRGLFSYDDGCGMGGSAIAAGSEAVDLRQPESLH